MSFHFDCDAVEHGPYLFHKYDPASSKIKEKRVFSAASPAIPFLNCDWNLARRGITIVRNVFKTVRAVDPKTSKVTTPAINGLGLIAAVNLVNSPEKIYDGCQDLTNCLKMHDYEWAALSGLEVGTAAGEGVDSGLVVFSCLHGIYEKIPFSEALADIMLPFALALTGVGMVLKGAEIHQTKQFIKQVESKNYIANDINDAVRTTAANRGRIKEITGAINKRTSMKIKLCASPSKGQKKDLSPERLVALAQRKITVGYISEAASSVQLCAYSMFFFPVIPPPIPLSLLTVASAIKLGIYFYENHTFDLGPNKGQLTLSDTRHSTSVTGSPLLTP